MLKCLMLFLFTICLSSLFLYPRGWCMLFFTSAIIFVLTLQKHFTTKQTNKQTNFNKTHQKNIYENASIGQMNHLCNFNLM